MNRFGGVALQPRLSTAKAGWPVGAIVSLPIPEIDGPVACQILLIEEFYPGWANYTVLPLVSLFTHVRYELPDLTPAAVVAEPLTVGE